MEQQDFEKVFEEYKQQSEQQAQVEADQSNTSHKEHFVAVKKNDDGISWPSKPAQGGNWITLPL